EPERLPFQEEIGIAVTVTGKCTRAEKHHNADDQQAQHSDEQKVSALSMHYCSVSDLLRFFRFGWDQQFLADLKFARVIDVIERQQFVVGDLEFLSDRHWIVA